MAENSRARFGRFELVLLLSFLVLDQGTKLWATAALTHRLDGSPGAGKLVRMYSPSEYRGRDGRTYVRNYGPKRERVLGGHLALRYSEDELEVPPAAAVLTHVWLLRGIWLGMLGLLVWLARRWRTGAARRFGATLLAGAALGTGFDFASHLFNVNWLELADLHGLTLRFNLAGVALFTGICVSGWSLLRQRSRGAPHA